jgi:hypothetical protein
MSYTALFSIPILPLRFCKYLPFATNPVQYNIADQKFIPFGKHYPELVQSPSSMQCQLVQYPFDDEHVELVKIARQAFIE